MGPDFIEPSASGEIAPVHGEVRYGPDTLDYARVDARDNPDHRAQLNASDCDQLNAKYQR